MVISAFFSILGPVSLGVEDPACLNQMVQLLVQIIQALKRMDEFVTDDLHYHDPHVTFLEGKITGVVRPLIKRYASKLAHRVQVTFVCHEIPDCHTSMLPLGVAESVLKTIASKHQCTKAVKSVNLLFARFDDKAAVSVSGLWDPANTCQIYVAKTRIFFNKLTALQMERVSPHRQS